MKRKNVFGILLISIITLCFSSCDKDDDGRTDPIRLSYENNVMFDNVSRSITVTPFIAATTPLYIKGGDGHYIIDNSNDEVVEAEYNGETIRFKPLALGTAIITIKDQSDNRYELTIQVEYLKYVYVVNSRNCFVEGDNLTVGNKKELENEILSSVAAERYEFTYTDKESTKGVLRLYGQKAGGANNYVEYEFYNERIDSTITVNDVSVRTLAQVILQNGDENILFYVTADMGLSKSTGGDMIVTRYCFVKDLTKRYKADYPALEKVHEVQTLYWKR